MSGSVGEVLGAARLEGHTVTEKRAGETLRLTEWESLDPRLACGITAADAGDYAVAGTVAEQLVDTYGGLATRLGFHAVSVPFQVHGSDIVPVGSDLRPRDGAPPTVMLSGRIDGQTTDSAGWLLVSTAADCVPVYLWDRERLRIALLHAGWRGVAAGILPRAIGRFRSHRGIGSEASDEILVHLGAAICGSCYEVDSPVLTALGLGGNRERLDLRGILVGQALDAGVSADALSASSHCTSCGPERLHSHRGSGGTAGRMAAFLGILTA